MKRANPWTMRMPSALLERLRAYAKTSGLTVAGTLRVAALRGLTQMEDEAARRASDRQQELPLGQAQPGPTAPPARRVLSRGVE